MTTTTDTLELTKESERQTNNPLLGSNWHARRGYSVADSGGLEHSKMRPNTRIFKTLTCSPFRWLNGMHITQPNKNRCGNGLYADYYEQEARHVQLI